MWARKVAPDPEAQVRSLAGSEWESSVTLSGSVSLQHPGDEANHKITSASAQDLDVDKSLASIRSHRSNKDEELQDDVPFGVHDWSPAWSDVATDGTCPFDDFVHAYALFFTLPLPR